VSISSASAYAALTAISTPPSKPSSVQLAYLEPSRSTRPAPLATRPGAVAHARDVDLADTMPAAFSKTRRAARAITDDSGDRQAHASPGASGSVASEPRRSPRTRIPNYRIHLSKQQLAGARQRLCGVVLLVRNGRGPVIDRHSRCDWAQTLAESRPSRGQQARPRLSLQQAEQNLCCGDAVSLSELAVRQAEGDGIARRWCCTTGAGLSGWLPESERRRCGDSSRCAVGLVG